MQPGPAGEVDDDARQRLVERHIGVTVAAQAGLVADRLGHRLAERDADVFHRVVAVDVQVALGVDLEVDQSVARDLVEHVVEEADAGGQLRRAAAVEIDAHADLRLLGVALHLGRSCHVRVGHHVLAFRASIIRVTSSGVPIVNAQAVRQQRMQTPRRS